VARETVSGVSHLRKALRNEENGDVLAIRGGIGANSLAGGIMTSDPVCGMRVDERKSDIQAQFAGRKYFFCSEECRKEFEADPGEYVEMAAA